MVLIKTRAILLFCLVFLFLFNASLFSQKSGVQFSAEIASIEKKLSGSKLPAPERKAALQTIARLFELSGNFERAAEAWQEAALAVPGNTDPDNMLQGARCLAAVGEFDKADAALRPVLAASGNRILQNNARLLSAQIEALKTGNTAVLANLLANPDFAGQKPALYYSIWKISANPAERSLMSSRLFAEFPQSPEARIVRDDNAVSAAPAALWLLAGIPLQNAEQPQASGLSGGEPRELSLAVLTPVHPAEYTGNLNAGTADGGQSNGPVLLQTGLFSLEENAKKMAAKLRNAGFRAEITKKTVDGKEHWTVGVAPGPNPSQTMLLLKEKGFESFPVYR